MHDTLSINLKTNGMLKGLDLALSASSNRLGPRAPSFGDKKIFDKSSLYLEVYFLGKKVRRGSLSFNLVGHFDIVK